MGVSWSGARAGGNTFFTRGGTFPLGLLEKGDGVANLVDSSLMEKGWKASCYREKTPNRALKISPCFSVGLPIPQTDHHLVIRKMCLRVGRPTSQTDHHRMVKERGARTRSRKKATRRHHSYIAARRVSWGGVRNAHASVPWLMAGVWSVYPQCRVYAAAEGNGAGSAGSRCRTQTMTEGNGAWITRSHRRNNSWLRGTTLEALVATAVTTP